MASYTLSRLIAITILIRAAGCLLCKPHFCTRRLLTVFATEASGIFVGGHLFGGVIFLLFYQEVWLNAQI
jgi:hypothetical protein